MRSEIFAYLEIASEIARKKRDQRSYWVGSVGIRNDGRMVFSSNILNPHKMREAHAEYKLTKKLDYGATVYVSRITRLGTIALAKPCANCEKAMRSMRVSRVYYTIADGEYGVMDLD